MALVVAVGRLYPQVVVLVEYLDIAFRASLTSVLLVGHLHPVALTSVVVVHGLSVAQLLGLEVVAPALSVVLEEQSVVLLLLLCLLWLVFVPVVSSVSAPSATSAPVLLVGCPYAGVAQRQVVGIHLLPAFFRQLLAELLAVEERGGGKLVAVYEFIRRAGIAGLGVPEFMGLADGVGLHVAVQHFA